MSTFVDHHTEQLIQTALSSPKGAHSPSSPAPYFPSPEAHRLQALLETFRPPYSSSAIQQLFLLLQSDGHSGGATLGHEERRLRRAAIGTLIAWIYGQVLDLSLQQATEADAEAGWWSDLERSGRKLAWYLLQTLPLRMKRVFYTVVETLRARNLAITPFSFTPTSLRQLFPTTLRPSGLAVSFFPHLSTQSRVLFRSPVELTRQECQHYSHALQQIRDDHAQRLGSLVADRDRLQAALASDTEDLAPFVQRIQQAIDDTVSSNINGDEDALVANLYDLTYDKLLKASTSHSVGISGFLRPSRLTRMWPSLILMPPVTLILFRTVYGARGSLREHSIQALETVSGFWRGYLVQPFRDILDTVRTGGEEGARIVSQEGVRSDMESLERMVVSLSREKYTLSPADLESLSSQIRRGDLTSVLKIYEEDLKSPLKSAVAGSLIRSLLIQVQKMKVDVDVALSGIDKLLKSQELTFAFVGVAPALAIVYGVVAWMRNAWSSGRGKGRYGGKRRRQAVWLSIRRIERLLTLSGIRPASESTQQGSLSSLDQGLILLSVAQLRTYAETYLPARSRLREEFLVDVSDLEDPKLGRMEKRDVVKRMWRSWSGVLQWSSAAET